MTKNWLYFSDEKVMLTCYIDVDLAGNDDSIKSTSKYLAIFVGRAIL